MNKFEALRSVSDEIRDIPISDIWSDLTGEPVMMKSKVRCIAHNDRNPSMGFGKGDRGYYYHCFSCGASGDAIRMTMTLRDMEWKEAVEYLAGMYHISIPEYGGREKGGREYPFPLSDAEMDLLGLSVRSDMLDIQGCTDDKSLVPAGYRYETDKDGNYLYGKEVRISLRTIWNGDEDYGTPEECRDLVLSIICPKLGEKICWVLSMYMGHIWEDHAFSGCGQTIQASVEYAVSSLYAVRGRLLARYPDNSSVHELGKIPDMPDLEPIRDRVQIAYA